MNKIYTKRLHIKSKLCTILDCGRHARSDCHVCNYHFNAAANDKDRKLIRRLYTDNIKDFRDAKKLFKSNKFKYSGTIVKLKKYGWAKRLVVLDNSGEVIAYKTKNDGIMFRVHWDNGEHEYFMNTKSFETAQRANMILDHSMNMASMGYPTNKTAQEEVTAFARIHEGNNDDDERERLKMKYRYLNPKDRHLTLFQCRCGNVRIVICQRDGENIFAVEFFEDDSGWDDYGEINDSFEEAYNRFMEHIENGYCKKKITRDIPTKESKHKKKDLRLLKEMGWMLGNEPCSTD
jgi:hypothetical protein